MQNLPFEVSDKDIQGLSAEQLSDLLRRLLKEEINHHQLQVIQFHVPGAINTADGGEDGSIELAEDPPQGCVLTNMRTVFQCKATDLSPSACKKEILDHCGTALKPLVKVCLDSGGGYVLFLRSSLTNQQIQKRIHAIREAIRSTSELYADTAPIHIFDANKIRDWTNQFLAAIVAVQHWHGRRPLQGLRTWNDWSGDQDFIDFPFVHNKEIDKQINLLRSKLSKPQAVCRLLGLSGLGKTRLVLEAFRPDKASTTGGDFSHEVVYLDVNGGENPHLPDTFISWRQSGLSGLLVVDNCPLSLHESLKKHVKHKDSKIRLLTLHTDPEEQSSDIIYKMTRMPDELIREMISPGSSKRYDADLNRVVKYAQGFPQMAVMIFRASEDGCQSLGNIVDDNLLDRLLGPKVARGSPERQVLEACSLFTMVGFERDREDEGKYVAEHFCRMEWNQFFEHVERTLKPRQLVQASGRFIRVEPSPLAIRLAADWWRGCRPDRRNQFLTDALPGTLSLALWRRIAQLDSLTQIKESVQVLCEDGNYFGNEEALNSDTKSQLFRCLAAAHPEAALATMERVFAHWTREKFLSVGPGRRNLIWTLERLCFRKEHFYRASRLLMAFAAAENESYANNATGIFLQLFEIFLAGTEASLEERMPVLIEALRHPDDYYRRLGIRGLERSLYKGPVMRIGGSEQFGSGPPRQQWFPCNQEEVNTYWSAVLKCLADTAMQNIDLSLDSRSIIGKHLDKLGQQLPQEMKSVFSRIIEKYGPVWPEALESIHRALKAKKIKMTTSHRTNLEEWLAQLTPPREAVADCLRIMVSIPPDQLERYEDGQWINRSTLVAIALAEELAPSFQHWAGHLQTLFKGEQRQGYSFGKRLGEVMDDRRALINCALDILADLEPCKANPMVLAAFLDGIRTDSPDLVQETLDRITNHPTLSPFLVDLIRIAGSPSDAERLYSLVLKEQISSEQLSSLNGYFMCRVSFEELIVFCQRLVEYDVEKAWVALDFLGWFCHGNESRYFMSRDIIRSFLIHPNLRLEAVPRYSGMEIIHWHELSIKMLEENDPELACHITKLIIDSGDYESYNQDLFGYILPVLEILLIRFQRVVWPMLADVLIGQESSARFFLGYFIRSKNDGEGSHPGVLFTSLPEDLIIQWCREHPDRAPGLIARTMPLFDQDGGDWRWHSFAKRFIDEFGDSEEILSQINVNMGCYSYFGEISQYYKMKRQAFYKLRDHKSTKVLRWAQQHIEDLNSTIIKADAKNQESEWDV
ncbi:MAG: hypothetical protein HQL84_04970 [Magnetococcales bacterium]|nr:hypothetical protein [Magnetococcales bacterium]MBF0149382.1 hypothetical protein [Magnetococcales bacterium]